MSALCRTISFPFEAVRNSRPEKKGSACGENETGPGALPGAKKNERLRYSGCVLTAEAEWPVKL